MSFFLLLNTKEDILKNNWIQILWKSMVPHNCLVPIVLSKYLPLCSAEERNSFNLRVSK